MPPKARFTRDEIVAAALAIVQKDGMQALTARALGADLESSARPIFTVFQSMEEVQDEVRIAARGVYNRYVSDALERDYAFKEVGFAYINFAKQEPKLFQLLYMDEVAPHEKAEVIMLQDDNHEAICQSIIDMYGIRKEDAWRLYEHLWVYTHGIASLCAMHVCDFTDEEIDRRITDVFKSLLLEIKRREAHD